MRRHERLIFAAAILGLLALWEVLARIGRIDATLAPAPTTIVESLVRLLGRPEVRLSLAVTGWEVLAAFLIALPTGLLLGFLLAEVPVVGALVRPLINFLFGVPKSIFLPVFILVFGVSISQKIAFGVFTTLFVVIVGGIAAMAPTLLESARLGMIFNITAVLLCEIYGARDGIGYRIAAWGENLQMPQLYAALVIVAALAVAINEGLRAIETRLGAWRQRA